MERYESKFEGNKEKLKEDHGWEIKRGKEWDAFEEFMDEVGAETMSTELAQAMGNDALGENLVFMFRNYDFQSRYLK